MFFAALLVSQDLVQVYAAGGVVQVCFHIRIGLMQFPDQQYVFHSAERGTFQQGFAWKQYICSRDLMQGYASLRFSEIDNYYHFMLTHDSFYVK